MRKERFDFVFALGSGCICTDILRQAGLQVEAFPMDWVGRQEVSRPIGQVMRDRTDIFISEFSGLLDPVRMELDPDMPTDGRHDHYNNMANGQAFFHDFAAGVPLVESFPAVREKYRRRIARFLRRIAKARRVLIVWLGDTRDVGRIGRDDIRYALDAFSRKYPKARFFMRVFECPRDFSSTQRESDSGDGFRLEAFDYRCYGEGMPVWKVRNDLIVEKLADCCFSDYRTLKERWEAVCRDYRADCSRFGASSFLELLWTKWQYKIYVKLKRGLIRKEIVA